MSALPANDAVAAPSASALPEGIRIYAVGDLHGRFDLLQEMAGLIRRDLASSPRARRTVELYLGDYIDRGPHSREVVAWLVESAPLARERICLMGNHEALLLEAMDDPEALGNWLYNGGDATLASYGLYVRPFARPAGLVNVGTRLRTALRPRHLAFFEGLRRMVDFDPYLFVHAGVRPGTAIAVQDPHDLIWIRAPFLNSSVDFGRVVVHGHTPVDDPDIRHNRINIDTGAFYSGRLTCLVLEGASRRILQTGAGMRPADSR